MLWNKLWLVIPNLIFYSYVVLLCTALYSTRPLYPGLPGVSNLGVYMKKHIKCWQGGREEAVLYGLWWEAESGRGSYINSQINKFNIYLELEYLIFVDILM